jgi:pyruvate dehydrogenase E2 component (dihydrolipoamide acetyltransferase)
MPDIVMPRLSDTMEEGTILRWLLSDGDHVARGQELVEIETDKATMVYESDQEGILHTLAQDGQTLAVGEPIATVGEAAAVAAGGGARATPASVDGEGPAPGGPAGADARGTPARVLSEPAPTPPPRDGGERVKASPLARRMARERGVDLGALQGSGPGGRIVKADVEGSTPLAPTAQAPAAAPAQAPGAAPAQAPAAARAGGAPTPLEVASAKGESREVELSRTQQTIARRMAESKATIPHFTLTVEVDMEDCVALRSELKRMTPEGEAAPTYNDMVVKASALALRANPRANSSYRDARLQLHARVNVGVAVATEGDDVQGGALIVPTVFDADRKALGEIARETRALAARVRDGTITPPELSGGTFTVSNLGMYAVDSFTAIINPPQAAILSVGGVSPRAVVRDGGISIRHTMWLTLACDHRILYGADAARFLAHIRELLERPAALTL